MKNGVGISKWQGSINWPKVKKSGIEFAIIRSDWGKESPSQKDKFFEQNYAGCKAVEIPVGTYHYSYADSISDAKSEAAFCLKNIAGKQLEYPVILDVEDRTMLALSTRLRTDICKAFCKVGKPAVNCGIWQKSDCGKIDGISGNVDLNEAYKDYPNIMKAKGLNGFSKNDYVPVNSSKPVYLTYTVTKDDTLWDIAQKRLDDGTKWPQIQSLSGLKSTTIYPGQVLKIPR